MPALQPRNNIPLFQIIITITSLLLLISPSHSYSYTLHLPSSTSTTLFFPPFSSSITRTSSHFRKNLQHPSTTTTTSTTTLHAELNQQLDSSYKRKFSDLSIPPDLTHKWYMASCCPGQERAVLKIINSWLPKHNPDALKDIEKVIVPLRSSAESRGKKLFNGQKVVYSGYIFIKCKLNEKTYSAINSTPKISSWVGHRKQITTRYQNVVPHALTETEISKFEGLLDKLDLAPKNFTIGFSIGDMVSISLNSTSPYAGEAGVVRNIRDSNVVVTVYTYGSRLDALIDPGILRVIRGDEDWGEDAVKLGEQPKFHVDQDQIDISEGKIPKSLNKARRHIDLQQLQHMQYIEKRKERIDTWIDSPGTPRPIEIIIKGVTDEQRERYQQNQINWLYSEGENLDDIELNELTSELDAEPTDSELHAMKTEDDRNLNKVVSLAKSLNTVALFGKGEQQRCARLALAKLEDESSTDLEEVFGVYFKGGYGGGEGRERIFERDEGGRNL